MKIEVMKKIKLYLENRKLKKMSDSALIKELEEKLMIEETENIHNIVGFVEDDKKQLNVAKELIESGEINASTKKQVIEKLPHQTQKELFRKSIKTKELLAQKDISTFLRILIKDKKLQPYDELYYRIDKAFNDFELAYMLRELQKGRPEAYSAQKVMGIIAKQIIVDIKKYESFLPSHLKELTDEIVINYGENEERKFDILNEEDRKTLKETMEREAEKMKEDNKHPITLAEKERITSEKLEKQINKMLQFEQKRQEELQMQGLEQAKKNKEITR